MPNSIRQIIPCDRILQNPDMKQAKPSDNASHAPTFCECNTICPSSTDVINGRPGNNVTDNIFNKIGMNLHRRADHPLCIIKSAIYQFMDQQGNVAYKTFDDLYPIVSTTVRSISCTLEATQEPERNCRTMPAIIMGHTNALGLSDSSHKYPMCIMYIARPPHPRNIVKYPHGPHPEGCIIRKHNIW